MCAVRSSGRMAANLARRRDIAVAGHRGDIATVRAALDDDDAQVRATALGALARAGALTAADLERAATDGRPGRAAAGRRGGRGGRSARSAARRCWRLLDDDDATVVEAAAWACGELTGLDADALRTTAVDTALRRSPPTTTMPWFAKRPSPRSAAIGDDARPAGHPGRHPRQARRPPASRDGAGAVRRARGRRRARSSAGPTATGRSGKRPRTCPAATIRFARRGRHACIVGRTRRRRRLARLHADVVLSRTTRRSSSRAPRAAS